MTVSYASYAACIIAYTILAIAHVIILVSLVTGGTQ
jgi:hypothetical protein